jgi:hypothetical protein
MCTCRLGRLAVLPRVALGQRLLLALPQVGVLAALDLQQLCMCAPLDNLTLRKVPRA